MSLFSCFYDSAYQPILVTVLAVICEFLKYNSLLHVYTTNIPRVRSTPKSPK